LRNYFHIGTGNYNSNTSKFYTDLGLLSTNPDIASDLLELFNYLSGFSKQKSYQKLLVSPSSMREKFIFLIKREIKNAVEGKKAEIIAKMNSLVDPEIIKLLYLASDSGVKIILIIRGICCLYPQRKNLSKIFLLKGNYKEGLKNYEYRYKHTNIRILPHASPNIPIWSGEDSERPDKLLIVSEQGLGDTLQFMRFLPLLRKKDQKVYFCAQEKLHGVIKNSKIDFDPLSPNQANKFSEGKWIPLLSLPKILNIRPNNQLIKAPYIYSDEYLINKWKLLFSEYDEKIIGIHWQGNPETEQGIHKGRSLLLNEFSTLAKNSKCKFLSLQKGYGEEQLKDCLFKDKFVDFQKEVSDIWDFVETSSIIANCDLIITSDSAVAHLAAGMGKKTWLLLQKVPDWRWGLKGSHTFWYENMEIFRQVEKNNWREVMIRVSIRLNNFLK